MTEEQKHSAAGSMAGMMYQVYYFLKQLLLLQPGESASLELYDDVALASGETIKYVQLKHTVDGNKRMTKRDHDLWKTLAMWVKIIQSKGGDEKQRQWLLGSEYVLLTNKDTEDNEFVALLEDFKRNGTDENAWIKLCDFIDKQATKNTANEDGKTNDVDNFAKALAEFKLKREFLQRVVVEEQSDDEILKQIDNVLEVTKYIKKASVPILRESILGRLVASFKNTISKGNASVYTAESFNQENGDIISKIRDRKFVKNAVPIVFPQKIDDMTFIKQLEDIHDNKVRDERNRLVHEFLCFSNDYNLSKSSLSDDEIMDFEKDVHGRWGNLFDDVYGENECSSELEMARTARQLLRATRKESVLFNGEYIGNSSSNGCYYYFSDGEHPTIGWRKDWKEKYNGKDWTEIYGY